MESFINYMVYLKNKLNYSREVFLIKGANMRNGYSKKNKHLTMDERLEIQLSLDHGVTFKDIAKRIGKDPTTVSKEVKKHFTVREMTVSKSKVDGTPIENRPCSKLLKAPFVCNSCEKKRRQCAFQKQIYEAAPAQIAYESLLKEARDGIPLRKEKFYENDAIITQNMKKGQHLYHIMQTHDLGVSKSTVYRHLNKGYLSVSKIDFPRVVKFKARKVRRDDYIPKAAKVGRTYDDFIGYTTDNRITSWVEMDTVIGRIGGKAILTFDFTFCNFIFGLLIDAKTAAEVTMKINTLKQRLRDNGICFGDIFPLLLTDNGGEFSNINAFIADDNGELEASVYFCDPYQSSQKPKIEKNHTMFRDIVEKGSSFDQFTQETVDLIFSHINSVKRKSLHGKSSFEIFSFTFGDNIAQLLGIHPIPADDVIQSPKLLKSISSSFT